MTDGSKIELLKAHLRKEGLCLCKSADTQYPVDGIKEVEALGAVVDLLDDAEAADEWVDSPTQPIANTALEALRAVSKVVDVPAQ